MRETLRSRSSAIKNKPAPIRGGGDLAAGGCGGLYAPPPPRAGISRRFIMGMVKLPVRATLVTDDPVMEPTSAEETTAILAGPPRMRPAHQLGHLQKGPAASGGHYQRTEDYKQNQQPPQKWPSRIPRCRRWKGKACPKASASGRRHAPGFRGSGGPARHRRRKTESKW